MDFFTSLLPAVEHMGVGGYWLVLLASLTESLAFVGELVPGGMIVILAGFLSAHGYLDLGDLIWFAAIGAIMGDGFSYWLGTKGTRFFRDENRFLKMSHLEKGQQFFQKYGEKSILLGRFLGPIRPIIPFVAGLVRMRIQTFLVWNVISGLLWAVGYLLFGYFFGGVLRVAEVWVSRAGFFMLFLLLSALILWFLVKRSKPMFSLLFSIIVSVKDAVIANSDVQKLIQRHPRLVGFIKKRLRTDTFFGLPLTLIFVSLGYIALLFFGVAVEVVTSSGPIVGADTRVANLLYTFRDVGLIRFFTLITLLGKWQIVCAGAIIVTILLWLWRRRIYIVPFWSVLAGSVLFNVLMKLAFHRTRPETAYYAEHGFSFPSGHATIGVAFYGFLAYILVRELSTWKRKASALFWALIIILLIGLSRLYLGVHYLSDVWGGYLLGLLFLIMGIALVEWQKYRQQISSPPTAARSVKILSTVLIAVWCVWYGLFAAHYHPPLTVPRHHAPEIVADILTPFQDGTLPQFTETLLGDKQEPLSFIIAARTDTQLIDAMRRAGWHLAERVSVSSIGALIKAAALNERYPTAPLTPSFWASRVHDFGFEKETPAQNVKERHHARFWKTNIKTADGKWVYVGTASFDRGVKWLVTHTISPDIDTERELLYSDLRHTGLVASSSKEAFVAPTLGHNFSGDRFFTDGRAYVIVLGEE